ncbi:hypothetical protein D3C72_1704300 [compost metagenome]
MRDRLVAGHADAVVGNGDGARILVEADLDLQFVIVAVQGVVIDRFKAQFVGRVGRVRNQFAQEDFLVRVQGMDHQVQHLLHFGLKTQGLLFGDSHFYLIVLWIGRILRSWGWYKRFQEHPENVLC